MDNNAVIALFFQNNNWGSARGIGNTNHVHVHVHVTTCIYICHVQVHHGKSPKWSWGTMHMYMHVVNKILVVVIH